jgi:N-acetylmuramoyl-L-alanine amidase
VSKKHTIVQGEDLPKLAEKYGFGDFRVIYNAPDNSELRRKRPNPNLLFPGDEIVIPDPAGKTQPAKTGGQAAFKADRPDRFLRLVLKNHKHEVLANEAYELRIKSGPTFTGKTDGSGKIEKLLPPRSELAELDVAKRTYLLRLGHLNPMRSTPDKGVSGIQGRLKNLGYYCGPASGEPDRATRIALALFQSDHGLTADGEPGESTQQKLEQEHGS